MMEFSDPKKLELIHSCHSSSFYDGLDFGGMDFSNLKQYSLSKWFQLSQIAVNRSLWMEFFHVAFFLTINFQLDLNPECSLAMSLIFICLS